MAAKLKKVLVTTLVGLSINPVYRLVIKPVVSGYHDYYYDQGGQFLKDRTVRHAKLSNFFKDDTYTLLTSHGESHPLEGIPNIRTHGEARPLISAEETGKKMATFVTAEEPKVKKMSLNELRKASRQGGEFDFKHNLIRDCRNCLYLDNQGVAHEADSIGNMTWGYLGASKGIPNLVAHLGAGVYEQLLVDRNSSFDWCNRALCDDPRDYRNIDRGYAWRRSGSAVPEIFQTHQPARLK